MLTKVFKVLGDESRITAIKECASIIRNGGTVAFPTETVYGLGANALSVVAVEKIYVAKNRPPIKPLSVCVSDIGMADSVAYINDMAEKLFKAFLPGPLTIVLPKRKGVPSIVTAGMDTVGIRVPSNIIAQGIVKQSGVPIALPSANLSGQGSLSRGEEVVQALFGRVDAVIDAGETSVGTESTIISLVDEPKILRLGAIPADEVLRVIT